MAPWSRASLGPRRRQHWAQTLAVWGEASVWPLMAHSNGAGGVVAAGFLVIVWTWYGDLALTSHWFIQQECEECNLIS